MVAGDFQIWERKGVKGAKFLTEEGGPKGKPPPGGWEF